MWYSIEGGPRPGRLVVWSYDIACARRAHRVRRVLDALHHDKQYSVYETVLVEGAFRGVLAELSAHCDFSEDRLAVWWPRGGLRLQWEAKTLRVSACYGPTAAGPARVPASTGNFVLCYDVSDPDALRAVAAVIAPVTVMVQRSVYWLRAPLPQLRSLLAGCADSLSGSARLWAYPLCSSHDLWHVGSGPRALLPITTHRWRAS